MIVIILILGFLLRLTNLNQSLWLDEAISVLAIKNNSYLSLLTQFTPGDFHPPLYYLILKFWDGLFGYSEIASRLPSVIFGMATVFFVYLVAKKLFSKPIALIAAIFMAVNPLAVYYSQEARMYALATFAVTAAMYFFLTKRWLWYFVFLIAVMYSDYLPWLILPVFFLFSLGNKKLLIAHFSLLIAFLPWAVVLAAQLHNILGVGNTSWAPLLGQAGWKNIALFPIKFVFGRVSVANKILYAGIAVSALIFYGSIIVRVKNRFLWAWLVIPLIFGLILSLKIPTLTYFRYLFLLPAFILLLAAGAKARWQIYGIVAISLLSLIYFHLTPAFWREDWRGFTAYVSNNPGLVLLPSLAQVAPFKYYAPKLPVADATAFSPKRKTIYLVRYVQEVFDPSDKLRIAVEKAGYHLILVKNFNGVVVWQYEQI